MSSDASPSDDTNSSIVTETCTVNIGQMSYQLEPEDYKQVMWIREFLRHVDDDPHISLEVYHHK